MQIDLQTVRQVLKDALGFDSFVAGFVNETVEDAGIATVGINADGELTYNPDFVAKYVSCQEDPVSLIFHELLHPMFCHFIYECKGRSKSVPCGGRNRLLVGFFVVRFVGFVSFF